MRCMPSWVPKLGDSSPADLVDHYPTDPPSRVSSRVISNRKTSYAIARGYALAAPVRNILNGGWLHPRWTAPREGERALRQHRLKGTGSPLEHGSRAAESVFSEAFCNDVVGFVQRIRAMEKVEVARTDRAVLHQCVEIYHLVPVFGAKEHNRHALAGLARLPGSESRTTRRACHSRRGTAQLPWQGK